jgi:hypothetical protein
MKKRCLFQGYDCAISICSRKRIADKLEALKVNKLSYKSRVGADQYLNPMIRGWIHDYGKCKMYALTKVNYLLSSRFAGQGDGISNIRPVLEKHTNGCHSLEKNTQHCFTLGTFLK